jgi:hypothetical protein
MRPQTHIQPRTSGSDLSQRRYKLPLRDLGTQGVEKSSGIEVRRILLETGEGGEEVWDVEQLESGPGGG